MSLAFFFFASPTSLRIFNAPLTVTASSRYFHPLAILISFLAVTPEYSVRFFLHQLVNSPGILSLMAFNILPRWYACSRKRLCVTFSLFSWAFRKWAASIVVRFSPSTSMTIVAMFIFLSFWGFGHQQHFIIMKDVQQHGTPASPVWHALCQNPASPFTVCVQHIISNSSATYLF